MRLLPPLLILLATLVACDNQVNTPPLESQTLRLAGGESLDEDSIDSSSTPPAKSLAYRFAIANMRSEFGENQEEAQPLEGDDTLVCREGKPDRLDPISPGPAIVGLVARDSPVPFRERVRAIRSGGGAELEQAVVEVRNKPASFTFKRAESD